MKSVVKKIILRVFGRNLIDADSGRILGRALIFFWRGRLLIYGYQGPPLRVEFLAEEPFSYRRRIVGFRKAIVPDEVNCVKKVVDHA